MSYFNLGTYHRPITTTSNTARTWFDRGLIWCYGFNHEEAAECFRRATKEDPDCFMAYWGIAFALGPNYNKPWDAFDEDEKKRNLDESRNAVDNAKTRMTASNCTAVERALVAAVDHRYPEVTAERSIWNIHYANAMEDVYARFGEDLDVAALYADALMNLTPWALWDLRSGEPAKDSRALEAKAVLDKAMAQEGGSRHPGLLHLYIHLMEMSQTPETALSAANQLRGLAPDAGHLEHMPTHLDVLCGDYKSVVSSNSDAIKADEKWLARKSPLDFYSLYRTHNYHFKIYGAMFAGMSEAALTTCAQLEESLPEDLLRVKSPPMADWLEGFLSMRVHVLIRFGRWDDILNLHLPKDQELYCYTTAITHYAKGIALANTGKTAEADKARALLEESRPRVPESRTLFNNTCRDLLAVASAMLDGEIEYHRGRDIDIAFSHLKSAIERSDNLPYDEPWGWMQPPRHALGALSLEQGRVDDAMAAYEADLGLDTTLPRALQHPKNVWSLHGYHECLVKLGRSKEAAEVKKQLDVVLELADVPIRSSCYCRSKVEHVGQGGAA